jgi:hypothetical protein
MAAGICYDATENLNHAAVDRERAVDHHARAVGRCREIGVFDHDVAGVDRDRAVDRQVTVVLQIDVGVVQGERVRFRLCIGRNVGIVPARRVRNAGIEHRVESRARDTIVPIPSRLPVGIVAAAAIQNPAGGPIGAGHDLQIGRGRVGVIVAVLFDHRRGQREVRRTAGGDRELGEIPARARADVQRRLAGFCGEGVLAISQHRVDLDAADDHRDDRIILVVGGSANADLERDRDRGERGVVHPRAGGPGD